MSNTVIAGKPSNTIGDKDSQLVLRGSSVKIQWGNKFIDLIKNGKINCETDKILQTASSIDKIALDGIYLIDKQIWIIINGTKIQLSAEESNSFVAFNKEQNELTQEQKIQALKNLGVYMDTYEDLTKSELTDGIVYIQSENKLYTIKQKEINEYEGDSLLPKGTIILFNDSTNIPKGWIKCDGTNGAPNLEPVGSTIYIMKINNSVDNKNTL